MILRLYHELSELVKEYKEKPTDELSEKIRQLKEKIDLILESDYDSH
jgi:hypothetical protein